MTTTLTATGSPHNHFNCARGCDAAPLTLIDREVITGRRIAEQDDDGNWYCADCLADLPRYANGNLHFQALSHVCGEEAPRHHAGPPEATAPAPQPDEAPRKASLAKVGDVVRYHGSLREYHGVWEVTCKDRRGLILFDTDRALWNVDQSSVTVVQTAAVRKRLLRKIGR